MREALPHRARTTSRLRLRASPFLLAAAALLSLSVCGPTNGGGEPAVSTAWTREGLEEQPGLDALRRGSSASLGYEPGVTPWQEISYPPSTEDPSARLPDAPGAVLAHVAESLGWMDLLGEEVWEQTLRVWLPDPDEAVGVVLQWGMRDDAVAGRDLRAHMMRVDGAWRVERVEQRFLCRRGVSEAGVCV